MGSPIRWTTIHVRETAPPLRSFARRAATTESVSSDASIPSNPGTGATNDVARAPQLRAGHLPGRIKRYRHRLEGADVDSWTEPEHRRLTATDAPDLFVGRVRLRDPIRAFIRPPTDES